MAFRFRKSFRVVAGVRVNVSKSGISTSIGGAPLTLNLGRRARVTASIPGTGLSASQLLPQTTRASVVSLSTLRRPRVAVAWILFLCCALGWCAQRNERLPSPSEATARSRPVTASPSIATSPPLTRPPVAGSTPAALPKPAEVAPRALVISPSVQPETKLETPVAEPAISEVVFATSTVNIRATPSSSAPIVGKLASGSSASGTEERDGWRRVAAGSVTGWVAARYLSSTAPPPPPTKEPPAVARFVAPAEADRQSGPIREPYVGRCECPYDVMSNGRSCGGRSAFSRPGGRKPICYQ